VHDNRAFECGLGWFVETEGKRRVGTRMKHYIITRLNLGRKDGGLSWCMERVGSIRDRIVPSLQAQTCQDFEYIVAIDAESNGEMVIALEHTLAPINSTIVYNENSTRFKEKTNSMCGTWLEYIKGLVPSGHRRVITSRLDSDDFLLPGYVEKVQEEANKCSVPTVIDFQNHMSVSDQTGEMFVSRAKVPTEACSVLEQSKNMKTAYGAAHTKLKRFIGNTVEIPSIMRWVKFMGSKQGHVGLAEEAMGIQCDLTTYDEFINTLKRKRKWAKRCGL